MQIVEAKTTPIYIYGPHHSWKTGMAIRTALQAIEKFPIVGGDEQTKPKNQLTLIGVECSLEQFFKHVMKIGGFKTDAEMKDFFMKRWVTVTHFHLGNVGIEGTLKSLSELGEFDNHVMIFDNISTFNDVDLTWNAAFKYAASPNCTAIVTEAFHRDQIVVPREEQFHVVVHMHGWNDGEPPAYTVHVGAPTWEDLNLNLGGK